MSFICSPALEAECSRANCSGTAASAPSRSIPTAKPSSSPDSKTARSRRSPSFPTYEPLTGDRGEALLTWWLAAFRAKTSAWPEAAQGSTASAPDSGEKWRASLARFDRDTSSWRTVQHSLLGGSESSSVTWPRSGMTADGRCYLRPTSAPRICAKGSGFWPTPTTQDNAQVAGQYKNPKSVTTLAGAVRMMPTPKASDGAKGGPNSIHGTGSLSLPAFAARYPTPCATAAKGWSPGHNRADTNDRLDYTIEREASQSGASGRLNPEFVEWLMGWPIGHTGLEPVATARLREWQQQHSPCSRPSSRKAA